MRAVWKQLVINLRLYFRNLMALIYGYLFPTIFLVAFWVLYRYDRVPLVRHVGELLTVTALGGACFGLPTTLVSERERGVWRRYRLTPIPTGSLVASTVAARYVLLLTAGLLQVALAMAIGMPHPPHPLSLFVAFSLVSFAFMGLGLVIATLADNVPAVQALGQCIFLPMLIIGGVAVQLTSLPDWAQHLSAFFPGRYAVEAIQASVTGKGLGSAHFALAALAAIGVAGCLAGAKLFRWDAQQRFASRGGKVWVGVALAAWVAVGVAAEQRGHVGPPVVATAASATAVARAPLSFVIKETPTEQAAASSAQTHNVAPSATPEASGRAPASKPAPVPVPTASAAPPATSSAPTSASAPSSASHPEPKTWQAVTVQDVDAQIDFDVLMRRLPDSGVVTPIAGPNDEPDADLAGQVAQLDAAIETWPFAKVADPMQRVRNVLFVASTIDLLQLPIEPYVPAIIFKRIQADIPSGDLIKILYWVAVHPEEGDDTALRAMQSLGINGVPDPEDVHDRAGAYAAKLLGRLLGRIRPS